MLCIVFCQDALWLVIVALTGINYEVSCYVFVETLAVDGQGIRIATIFIRYEDTFFIADNRVCTCTKAHRTMIGKDEGHVACKNQRMVVSDVVIDNVPTSTDFRFAARKHGWHVVAIDTVISGVLFCAVGSNIFNAGTCPRRLCSHREHHQEQHHGYSSCA